MLSKRKYSLLITHDYYSTDYLRQDRDRTWNKNNKVIIIFQSLIKYHLILLLSKDKKWKNKDREEWLRNKFELAQQFERFGFMFLLG